MSSTKRTPLALLLLLTIVAAADVWAADATSDGLAAAIASNARTPKFIARDKYRHPLETLHFFGLRPDQTVVEIWPGGGWYMEILAPYLRDHGHYYAAIEPPELSSDSKEATELAGVIRKRIADDPTHFGKVTVTELHAPQRTEICPAGTADLVLTFRNVHNWIEEGNQQQQFDAFFKALKPGGVLGVVEHRAKPGVSLAEMNKSGYVDEAYVKKLATTAGFKFAGASPVNDNPRDTKDYPKGVWTLPPTLTLGDQDREKYLAIGESDRMTLKFVKPAG
ncbi:MAG: class I SAM-dependent methyltransferase [Gammaproteobacteria bacterium]|nr:class I SAM-dependent methyltransferase [Gammaproteobacteria bacterium]